MTADAHALARALHRAHWDALTVLHGSGDADGDVADYDLESPSRRSYLVEQARALIDAGWRVIPPP